jgi:hypothetical protein
MERLDLIRTSLVSTSARTWPGTTRHSPYWFPYRSPERGPRFRRVVPSDGRDGSGPVAHAAARAVRTSRRRATPSNDVLRSSGHYGPRDEVTDDADEQTRLVAFTGRQP